MWEIALLVLAIAVVTGLLARRALKADANSERGLAPGQGDHTIHVDYSSGLGGHSVSYTVPRDPQEYAKRFVPKQDD